MRSFSFALSLVAACGGSVPSSASPSPDPAPSTLPAPSGSAPVARSPEHDTYPVESASAPAPTTPARPARVAIAFELLTPGAEVRLVNGADQRSLTVFPIRVNFDTSQTWEVRARKPGYCTFTQKLDFDRPTVRIELRRGCR